MTTAIAPTTSRAYVSLRDDVPANGSLYICSHSCGIAFAFEGDPGFIRRWYNFAVNTGIIGENAQLHYYLERQEGNLAYVCAASREVVLRGLVSQFRWEIIRDREVPLLVNRIDPETELPEIEFDEAKIDELAVTRAQAFMRDHIKTDRSVVIRPKDAGETYVWTPQRTGTDD